MVPFPAQACKLWICKLLVPPLHQLPVATYIVSGVLSLYKFMTNHGSVLTFELKKKKKKNKAQEKHLL